MYTDSCFNLHQKIVQPEERNITKRWHICSSQIAVGLLDLKMLHEPEEPVSKRTKDGKERERERGEGEKMKERKREKENSWVQRRSFTLLRVIQLHVFWFFTVSSITSLDLRSTRFQTLVTSLTHREFPSRLDTCFFLQFADTSSFLLSLPPSSLLLLSLKRREREREKEQSTCTAARDPGWRCSKLNSYLLSRERWVISSLVRSFATGMTPNFNSYTRSNGIIPNLVCFWSMQDSSSSSSSIDEIRDLLWQRISSLWWLISFPRETWRRRKKNQISLPRFEEREIKIWRMKKYSSQEEDVYNNYFME